MPTDGDGRRRRRLVGLGFAGVVLLLVAPLVGRLGLLLTGVGVIAAGWSIVGLALTWQRSSDDLLRREREVREERADLEAERRLHLAILSNLATAVAAFQDGRLVYADRRAEREMGTRVETVEALSPTVLRHAVESAAASAGIHQVRFEVGHPPRTIEATATATDPDGVVVLLMADVSQRELADKVRRDFVSAASHELKTPAAAIQAAAETVLTALKDDPEAVRNFSGRVYENATRLSRIVSDLLDLSRLEAESVEMEPLDLGTVVKEELARSAPTSVELASDIGSVPMMGSAPDLALAFRNLLQNAVRYTEEGGHVHVRVGGIDGGAFIEVTDDGVGIPSRDLPRVFERFYRVDAARSRATGGTGLGLAIVKHVAEQHGGGVEAESVLGEGSTFRITLPQSPDQPGR